MSTETTNKKIKIDNGTTFGRTYTDKAVDELLKNIGGGGKSVPPTLNLIDFETGAIRTTITEEEYNNLKNGLYNAVNYCTETPEEAYLQSKLLSIYDDINKTLSCNFSSIKINVTSETDISSTNILYDLTIGQKDTNGNYPITIEKLSEIPFGSNSGGSGGSGASLNVVTIDNFNNGDHNQQGFVMPTEDVVLFTDNALVSLIGCKNVQNGVISYLCSQWKVSVKDDHYRYVCDFYEITKSTGGYHIETSELGVSPEFLPNYSGNDNGKVLSVVNGKTQWATPTDSLTLPSKPPYSQLIPSITTSNTQQNLTIGNGLTIENGALKTTSGGFNIFDNTFSIGVAENINEETFTLTEVGLNKLNDMFVNGKLLRLCFEDPANITTDFNTIPFISFTDGNYWFTATTYIAGTNLKFTQIKINKTTGAIEMVQKLVAATDA